ncbi:MAG: hypothetical protein AAGD05_18190, partial [Bacteroidota bacterium]
EDLDYFKQRLGLSYLLGGNVGYRINKNYQIFGGCTFQHQPQSIRADGGNFTQQYNYINIQIGLRKNLGQ